MCLGGGGTLDEDPQLVRVAASKMQPNEAMRLFIAISSLFFLKLTYFTPKLLRCAPYLGLVSRSENGLPPIAGLEAHEA